MNRYRFLPSTAALTIAGLSLFSAAANAQTTTPPNGDLTSNTPAIAAKAVAEASPVSLVKLGDIKTKGAAAIADRLTRVQTLSARLAGAKGDCGDNANVTTQLGANTTGLTALASTLAAETDLTKAKAEYKSIFGDYRIYVLQVPKTDVALNCGNNIARAAKLQTEISQLQTRIDAAAAKNLDVTASKAALATATSQLALVAPAGLAADKAIVGLTPDKGDKAALATLQSSVKAAVSQVRQANSDLTATSTALKAARAALPHATKTPKKNAAGTSTTIKS